MDKYAITFKLDTNVKSLNDYEKLLTTESGETIKYDQLLIASGSRPKTQTIEGTELPNVFTLNKFSEALGIQKEIKSIEGKKHVVIVGAGFVGNESAASIKSALKEDVEVTVVHRSDIYAKTFGAEIGNVMKEVNEEHGINYVVGTLEKINQADGKANEIELADGTKIKADVLVMSQGVVPNTEWLPDTIRKDKSGHINCSITMRSTGKSVWAAGDCASHPCIINEEQNSSAHYSAAIMDGSVAAHNMMDKMVPNETVPLFWTSQFMVNKIFHSGVGSDWDRTIIHGDLKKRNFMAYHFLTHRLCAVSSMGRVQDVLLVNTAQRMGKVIQESEVEDGTFDITKLRKEIDDSRPGCLCQRASLNKLKPGEYKCCK